MSSEDDNGRSDEYWMGVRDALRMVDSFNKWAKRNPGRAKDLDDFIHDGLIAAAKRCESCLRDKMGISFVEDDDKEEVDLEEIPDFDDDIEDKITLDESREDDDDDDDKQESSFEEPISHDEPEPFTPPPDISDETSITLDTVERRVDEEMEDLSIEGPPREFSTDFELVEPTPLIVDEAGTVSEPISEPEPEEIVSEPSEEEVASPPEPEEIVSEPSEEEVASPPESEVFVSEPSEEEEVISLPESEVFVSEPSEEEEVISPPESEELPDKPAFTWSEYEDAVTPSSEPEPLDSEIDIVPSEEETTTIEEPEEVIEEPPEPPTVWSTSDEPSVVEEDTDEEAESAADEPEVVEAEEDEPVISEPPAPPPPPESEEDEEERKRRARRLFFGA
ncbi:MAG: hypothetical protein RTU63_11175 [Candidatus Thorarchaeota archaeon]